MLSLHLAQQLKAQKISWRPQLFDFFFIPDRDMDDRLFVISDISTYLGVQDGSPIIQFHGAEEWALDQIATREIVWMPTEEQLRQTLEQRLLETMSPDADLPLLTLARAGNGYRCTIKFRTETLHFDAPIASDAYAMALLHLLA
ncbi:MAG: hypothetical protein Fur0022_23520 [Anaerolineales bacterium]